MKKCKDIVDKYIALLNQSFTVEETENGCLVSTPFVMYNGEAISFYVEDFGKDNFRITDVGETLLDLETINVNVNTGKEKRLYDEILHFYDVHEDGGEIHVDASIDNLPKKILLFVNALQSLYDLEYLKVPSRMKKFAQKVHEYCQYHDLRHNYLYQIKIDNVPYTIDITSKNLKNLIQTIGTYQEIPSQLKKFTEGKLYPFLELQLLSSDHELYNKFYKVVIYDDEVEWDGYSMYLMERHSDDLIKYENREKLEEYLTV